MIAYHEEVSGVGVLKESRLLTGVAYMFAKGGKRQ